MVTKGGARPGAGRPTKRTPELVAKLLNYLRQGNNRRTACAAVGISQQTFERWSHNSVDFVETIQKAEADAVAESLSRIRLAGERKVWQADAWFLERKYPQEWGLRSTLDVNVVKERVAEMADERGLSEADKKRAVDAVERLLRSAGRV